MTYDDARARLSRLADVEVGESVPPLTVTVPAVSWASTAEMLRDELGCRYFSFMSAVDWKEDGLEVVACVDNVPDRLTVMLKARLGPGETRCPSLVPVYRGANWMERECFDMFGIRFEGHPDPRRILLPDDWEGYPLLKSYDVDTPYPPYR